MTVYYTHRSLSCSDIVREASSCSRCEKFRDPYLGHILRVRDLFTLSFKWNISLPPIKVQEILEEEVGKYQRQREWQTPKNQVLLDTTGLTYILRDYGNKQETCRGLRRPLAQKHCYLINVYKRKSGFLQCFGLHATFKGSPHAQHWMDNYNMNSILFVNIFFLIMLCLFYFTNLFFMCHCFSFCVFVGFF